MTLTTKKINLTTLFLCYMSGMDGKSFALFFGRCAHSGDMFNKTYQIGK
jgi:NADH:ubiquinone oxidoreductase subunit B-like Fe-S oxidoreductase